MWRDNIFVERHALSDEGAIILRNGDLINQSIYLALEQHFSAFFVLAAVHSGSQVLLECHEHNFRIGSAEAFKELAVSGFNELF